MLRKILFALSCASFWYGFYLYYPAISTAGRHISKVGAQHVFAGMSYMVISWALLAVIIAIKVVRWAMDMDDTRSRRRAERAAATCPGMRPGQIIPRTR